MRNKYFFVARDTVTCVVFFNTASDGRLPWETGRPQTEFMQLEQAGEILGSVLDVGCGTGENALYLAA